MSILINGLGLPVTCQECAISNFMDFHSMPHCGITKENICWQDYTTKRCDNCPLVSIPPHGRLIDADKTLGDAWRNFSKHENEWAKKDDDYIPFYRFFDQSGFECCLQTIRNAPTIIEAEEGNR